MKGIFCIQKISGIVLSTPQFCPLCHATSPVLRRCVTEKPVTGQGIDRVVFNEFVLGNFLTAIKFNCPSDPYLSGNSLVCLGQKDIMT